MSFPSQSAVSRLILPLLCVITFVFCVAAHGVCEEPVKATVCQIKSDPPAYNHKLVEVSGFVSHAFEDFSVYDPDCPSWPWVWLEYGGKSRSGTMYCCGVSTDRHSSKELVVEGIPIPLLTNSQFQQFDKAIQPPFRSGQHGAVVHATLVGRFFAGELIGDSKAKQWAGYGHMGCCTLLAIQEIKAADTQNNPDLDYGGSVDQPDIAKAGCGYRPLLPIEMTASLRQWQQQAESGAQEWAFDDPQHVASTALVQLLKLDAATLDDIRLIRETQGRKVYQWKPVGKPEAYMVVVSRQYWLSFYTHGTGRVAWAPLAVYESSCNGKNAVTRIK